MKYFLSFAVTLLISLKAEACSFAPGYFEFQVDPEEFEIKRKNDVIALLPAPEVKVDKVIRGSALPGSSCSDAGAIRIIIEWPIESVYSIEEVGFYFQSENGLDPDLIFPLEPIIGRFVEGNTAEFIFKWLDGHPKYQKALNFNVNVFAVNKGLQIGPPTTITIKANKGLKAK